MGKRSPRPLPSDATSGWMTQDKITVFILPKAGETKETIDLEALKAFGGEVVKSGDAVIKAKVPILLLDQIADHVKGINFIKQPDRPHIEASLAKGSASPEPPSIRLQDIRVRTSKWPSSIWGLQICPMRSPPGFFPHPSSQLTVQGAECAPTDFPSEEEPHGTAVAEIVHDMAPAPSST